MIRSTMRDYQLTIPAIMRHGARAYHGSEYVTRTGAHPPGQLRAGSAERWPAGRGPDPAGHRAR
jgi:hypothetical protein